MTFCACPKTSLSESAVASTARSPSEMLTAIWAAFRRLQVMLFSSSIICPNSSWDVTLIFSGSSPLAT